LVTHFPSARASVEMRTQFSPGGHLEWRMTGSPGPLARLSALAGAIDAPAPKSETASAAAAATRFISIISVINRVELQRASPLQRNHRVVDLDPERIRNVSRVQKRG
jgi:hypothetical protein